LAVCSRSSRLRCVILGFLPSFATTRYPGQPGIASPAGGPKTMIYLCSRGVAVAFTLI
jgi:hypothetical protein